MGHSNEQHHEHPSNKETIDWYKECLQNGKVSEETFKREAVTFFNLSPENSIKSKQIFKKEIENFITMHKNMQRKLLRDFLEENGGTGVNYEIPPKNFKVEVADEKERRKIFSKSVREKMQLSQQYQDWLGQNCCLLPAACCLISGKKPHEKKDLAEGSNNQINLVRERSSGKNIFDAEKTVITKCQDGTTKKSVIKETFAKVTIRKRQQTDKEKGKGNDISGSGEIKRAKGVDNILNHVTEHDKGTKAALVAKIIDKEGAIFGQDILKKSKVMKETQQLDAEKTAGIMTGTRGSEYMFRQLRTGFNKELGYSPLASQRKVEAFREKVLVAKKEDWDCQKMNIYTHKQGKNKGLPTETPVLQVKCLESYIAKMAESEALALDLSAKELPICFDADAGGGRFLAVFAFLNRNDQDIKLHPFLLYEGSDTRKNMEITLGKYSEEIRDLEGKEVIINDKIVKIKLFGLFDLCALNCLIGKQNHSSANPCAWTNVAKDHLQNHAGKEHIPSECQDVKFLSIDEYERNVTHHIVGQEGKTSAKSGKDFGSVTGMNLFPLENIFRYLPPLMHIVMGLANDVLKELKKDVIKCDEEEKVDEGFDDNHKQAVQENLIKMYSEVEDLEAQLSNTSLAKMVILNDLKRVALLKKGLVKEAEKVSKENYGNQNATRKNERQSCGAASCLLFTIDVKNDWDQILTCKNTCKVHLRCEGIALVDEDEELPDGYTCVQCQTNKPNNEWIEETLKTKNQEFTKIQTSLNRRITSIKADIAHNEQLEESESGPRQRQLKNAMKKLGDIARYHGGDLQGKQVQKMLDDARDETFEIIACVKDHENLHSKYSTALTCLANVSDALKTSGEDYEDEDTKMVQSICEEWGKIWPTLFPERNITPKGHILAFVLPKVIEEHKTFFRFYKVEEKGESIHATMNDIDRKCWVIKNKQARLWKLIERYELRNVTNVAIVVPLKRIFKKDRL